MGGVGIGKVIMCVIEAAGSEFDVEGFLKRSCFVPTKVYHKGERTFPNSARNLSVCDTSGFKVVVSEESWDDLPAQIDEAILFLRLHVGELQRLQSFPGVEDIVLAFPYNLRIDGETIMAQFDYLPPELVVAAANIGAGVALTLYPTEKSL